MGEERRFRRLRLHDQTDQVGSCRQYRGSDRRGAGIDRSRSTQALWSVDKDSRLGSRPWKTSSTPTVYRDAEYRPVGAFALLALMLASVGLYGCVLSYARSRSAPRRSAYAWRWRESGEICSTSVTRLAVTLSDSPRPGPGGHRGPPMTNLLYGFRPDYAPIVAGGLSHAPAVAALACLSPRAAHHASIP